MRALIPTFLALLLGAAPCLAQLPRALIREDYDPKKTRTQLRVTPLFDEIPPSGFVPVRVFVYNGFAIPRRWDLDFVSGTLDYANDGNELRSDFTVECPPGKTIEYDMLVPVVTAFRSYAGNSTDLGIRVRATGLRSSQASHATEIDPRWPSVMISEDLFTANRGGLSTEVNSYLSGLGSRHHFHGGSTNLEFGAAFNPKQMPEDWRAYSGFDCCLMKETDWQTLAPGARTALLEWNRLGGALLIYSGSPVTDLATLGIDSSGRGIRSATRSWGEVQILNLPSTGLLKASATVRLVASTLPAAGPGNRSLSLHEDFNKMWPLQAAFGTKKAHIVFFILVLIGFGVLVGPVNLFVFAKAGQRHRLFITTPLISLGASLLLVVLILFQDGFGGRGQRLVLMEVRSDDQEDAAYLAQEQIARTGVLLSTRFEVPEPASLAPVLIGESRWARVTADNSGNGRYTVRTTGQGLDLAGDWFQSRSEHGHVLETIRPTRGRIELLPGSATPTITSTFEFPLDELYFRGAAGDVWTATGIEQGRRVALTPADPKKFQRWLNETARFAQRNQKRFARTHGRRGAFFATSGKAPAIETLRALTWESTHTVLTGPIYKGK